MRTFLAALLLVSCCSGCLFKEYVPVKSPWPELQCPEKPKVEISDKVDASNPDTASVIKAAYVYERYATNLQEMIAEYNATAKKHNEEILNSLR